MLALWVVLALLAGLAIGATTMWHVAHAIAHARSAGVDAVADRLKNELHEANAQIAQMQRDSFLALANERFSAVVSPVQQKLHEFDALVKAIEKERVGAYEGLKEQISGLIERSGKMETAATQLSSALRNPTARGKWGEVQLRRVVELAGMEAYCDYNEQQTFEVGEERGRPDMTVALPGNAKIFVDAKVPLNAYLDAVEASDEAARRFVAGLNRIQIRIQRHFRVDENFGVGRKGDGHVGTSAIVADLERLLLVVVAVRFHAGQL